jgi:murein L,D-transpeptidase YcbB/YkuD
MLVRCTVNGLIVQQKASAIHISHNTQMAKVNISSQHLRKWPDGLPQRILVRESKPGLSEYYIAGVLTTLLHHVVKED